MVCKVCGFSNSDGSVFCENCGTKLEEAAPAYGGANPPEWDEPQIPEAEAAFPDRQASYDGGFASAPQNGEYYAPPAAPGFEAEQPASASGKKKKLSRGAIAGIVIGSVGLLSIILIIVGAIVVRKVIMPKISENISDGVSDFVSEFESELESELDFGFETTEEVETEAPAEPAGFAFDRAVSVDERYVVGNEYYPVGAGADGVEMYASHSASGVLVGEVDNEDRVKITELWEDTSATDPKLRFWGKGEVEGFTGWVPMYYLVNSTYHTSALDLGDVERVYANNTWRSEDGSEPDVSLVSDGDGFRILVGGSEAEITEVQGSLYGTMRIDIAAEHHFFLDCGQADAGVLYIDDEPFVWAGEYVPVPTGVSADAEAKLEDGWAKLINNDWASDDVISGNGGVIYRFTREGGKFWIGVGYYESEWDFYGYYDGETLQGDPFGELTMSFTLGYNFRDQGLPEKVLETFDFSDADRGIIRVKGPDGWSEYKRFTAE